MCGVKRSLTLERRMLSGELVYSTLEAMFHNQMLGFIVGKRG